MSKDWSIPVSEIDTATGQIVTVHYISGMSDAELAAVERSIGVAVEVIRVPGWRDDAHYRLGDRGTVIEGSGNPMAPLRVEFPDGDRHDYTWFELDYAANNPG